MKESITRFIGRKLKLKVNETKSSVIQPGYSKYLGFGFTHHRAAPKIRIHSKSLQRFRRRLRAYIWKQWKLPKTKLRELRKRGLPDSLARPLAATRKGPWHSSANGYLARALPTQYFTRALGLVLPG